MSDKRSNLIRTHFSDVPELYQEMEQFGSLGGTGAVQHFSTHQSTSPQGMQYNISCDNCGKGNSIVVGWGELVVVASRAMPQGWKFANGKMYPDLGCAHCNHLATVSLTPDEAAKAVNGALQAQVITPQYVEQVRSQIRRR